MNFARGSAWTKPADEREKARQSVCASLTYREATRIWQLGLFIWQLKEKNW